MKCRNCKKEIPKGEVFCEECKEALKDASSTEEVKELEELIQERKKVDNLETTKDLTNITELVKEEVKKEEVKEEKIVDEIDEDFKDVKDTKLSIIVIVLIVGIVLGALGFGVFWFLNRPKKIEEAPKQVIDYEKIINEYGDMVSEKAKDYIKEHEEIPTWQELSELVKYDKYEINCETHNVYIDGTIYLQHCKVNNKTVKYTYGKIIEDAKGGKELKIYKDESGYTENETGEAIGSIVCNTISCEYYKAFDKYVIVKEKDAYYLYNYETNTLDFGPFTDFVLLSYNDELYGIYYILNGQSNIYNTTLSKSLKNIKGKVEFEKNYIDTGIQYKYGYLITYDDKYNFVNIITGNISFSIIEDIKSFIEDIKSGILYITVAGSNNKFKIYNSNGKLMFNGTEFTDFKILDNSLITFTENNFKVYDSKLTVKVSSNNYNKILRVYDDFIIVVDKKVLKIVDYEDKEIASFTKLWDNEYKIFDKTFEYNSETQILKLTFEFVKDDATKYYVYSYNFGAKLTNEEELGSIE